jgi:hypothetical protein
MAIDSLLCQSCRAAERGCAAERAGNFQESATSPGLGWILSGIRHPGSGIRRTRLGRICCGTIGQLRVPVLAIFGELDNNIVAENNNAGLEPR